MHAMSLCVSVCVGQCASGAGHVSQLSAHTVGPQTRLSSVCVESIANMFD